MNFQPFYQSRQLDDSVAVKAGFNPYYPDIQSGLSDPILIERKQFINLASNNYLGLSNDSRLKEAAINAIRKYGVSMCATPVASGYSDLFRKAEESLTEFTGLEDSLIFPSCYQANNGIFKAIAHPDDIIIFDRFSHSSLIEGIRVAGCANRPFRHNDLGHLDSILKHSTQFGQAFVVTESVFSTEGAIAPIEEIYDLCKNYAAVPVIDDSHGLGVIGKMGKGILEHVGIANYQGIYTASLGKALAVNGGVVAGKRTLIRYLRYSTPHLIYSTAISPASLNGLIKVLEIIKKEFPMLSARMWEHSGYLKENLRLFGYTITQSETPILSISSGNSEDTLVITKSLYEKGLLVTPFIFPSVPENGGRIRLIAGANLENSSIIKACSIFESVKKEMHEKLPYHKSLVEGR